jgi:hypothetical protein
MSNSFLSPTAISREALRILHNNLVFAKGVNRMYDDKFANSGATMSGKIGPSLQVRKPNRYTVRTGAALQLQDAAEEYVTVNCTTQKGIDIHFTSADLTLTIDEFGDRYLKPAMSRLASEIDYIGLSTMAPTVYNLAAPTESTGAMTGPASALLTYLNAGRLLDENCAPRDNQRYAVLSPATQAATVNALSGLYQKADLIGQQYAAGEMGTALGFTFKMDQNVAAFTKGTRTNTSPVTTVNATNFANGTTTISVTGGTSGGVYQYGDVFTVAGCYAVNPETKISTGSLQQFVVTTTTTAVTTDAVTVAFAPTMYISGALQNISKTDGSKALVFAGTASTAYQANLCYHKDAFTLVSADLVLPKGVDFAAREVMDGVSLRIVRAYDINNDRFPCRFDVLFGWKELYPQWACRVEGNAA